MRDLADRLIERQRQEKQEREKDDLGIPIPPNAETNIDYAVVHIIGHNPKMYKYNDKIYLGHKEIKETLANCVKYSHHRFKSMSSYGYILIWEKVKSLLPELNLDKIVISDHLAFNIVTGQLEESEEPWLTI